MTSYSDTICPYIYQLTPYTNVKTVNLLSDFMTLFNQLVYF